MAAHAALRMLSHKVLSETEIPILVLLCVLCFQGQPFVDFV